MQFDLGGLVDNTEISQQSHAIGVSFPELDDMNAAAHFPSSYLPGADGGFSLEAVTNGLGINVPYEVQDVYHQPQGQILQQARRENLPSLNTSAGSHVLPPSQPWRKNSLKRGFPMGAGGKALKRAVSTSNVRETASMHAHSVPLPDNFPPNTSPSSAIDKRRNKLGYHRTSVACGHCRRRKIRCLISKDETNNRCTNCIRLKKECNFYPVDTAITERRPRSMSKPEFPSHDASSSSSSPSPGIKMETLTGGGPRSVTSMSTPGTPIDDMQDPLGEALRRSSLATGRASASHSRAASRRPSIAHLRTATAPLPLVRSVPDLGAMRFGKSTNAWVADLSAFGDPNATLNLQHDPNQLWRFTSSPLVDNVTAFPPVPEATALHTTPYSSTPDIAEISPWSSRVNSIDHGQSQFAHYPYSTTFSYDLDGNNDPLDRVPPSASTVSLPTSISEASQLSAGLETPSSAVFMSGLWSGSVGNAIPQSGVQNGIGGFASHMQTWTEVEDSKTDKISSDGGHLWHSLQSPMSSPTLGLGATS